MEKIDGGLLDESNKLPSNEISDNVDSEKDCFNLSEIQRENYTKKVEFIKSDWFQEMRKLEKDEKLFLSKEWLSDEEFKKHNTQVNKLIVKNVLLDQFELSYKKFQLMWWDQEQYSILESCKKNWLNYLNEALESSNVDNKKLRKCAKISRGETFLFSSGEVKDKCIWLELKKVWERKDLDILEWQKYFLQRHIDDGIDITHMSDVLLQWKKLFDFYLAEKKIKYIVSSSWLFDDEFNEFWMNERKKEWKLEIPNRVKIRRESLNYGWILPPWEAEEDVERFFIWWPNSMTRAFEKYKEGWKKIKEGKWYIDLEKLENWKLSQKQ